MLLEAMALGVRLVTSDLSLLRVGVQPCSLRRAMCRRWRPVWRACWPVRTCARLWSRHNGGIWPAAFTRRVWRRSMWRSINMSWRDKRRFYNQPPSVESYEAQRFGGASGQRVARRELALTLSMLPARGAFLTSPAAPTGSASAACSRERRRPQRGLAYGPCRAHLRGRGGCRR